MISYQFLRKWLKLSRTLAAGCQGKGAKQLNLRGQKNSKIKELSTFSEGRTYNCPAAPPSPAAGISACLRKEETVDERHEYLFSQCKKIQERQITYDTTY